MKKVLALFLIFTMILLLPACNIQSEKADTKNEISKKEDNEEGTEKPADDIKLYNVGDTVTSDNWEFTLNDFYYTTSLNLSQYDISNFLTADGDNKEDFCYAGEDRAFAVFTYDVSYLGTYEDEVKYRQNISLKYNKTETYREALPTSSANITEYFYVKKPPVFEGDDDWYFEAGQYTRFGEEDTTKEIRAYIVIPKEVMEDDKEASTLSVRLDGEEYIYTIK